MQAIKLLLAIGFVGGASLAGCSDDAPAAGGLCTPGKQEACACPGGAQGVQSCNASGNGYDACLCGGSTSGDNSSNNSSSNGNGNGSTTAGGGSNPSGGAGGGTASACMETDCESCAQGSCAANECSAAIDACTAESSCDAFGMCILACMDEMCFDNCITTHGQTGADLYANQEGCKYCTACSSSCSELCG